MTDKLSTEHQSNCVRLSVAEDACYLLFSSSHNGYHHSREIGTTVRGESLVADYDDSGKILAIEIFAHDKPCQR
jgi:uncharacterized protein YuzE